MWAAGREDLRLLELLIAAGAHLDARARSGSTALSIAVSNHKVAATARLLEAGADPDIPDDLGETPLYEASSRGYSELVSQLLAARADPGIPAKAGRFPLTTARSMDKVACAARLVAALTRFPYAQALTDQHGASRIIHGRLNGAWKAQEMRSETVISMSERQTTSKNLACTWVTQSNRGLKGIRGPLFLKVSGS